MSGPARSNPLVGHFDAGTLTRVEAVVEQALRPIRTRFVNRLGSDVPLSVSSCEFLQAGSLADRLMAEKIGVLARARMTPSGLPLLIGLDVVLLFRLIGNLLGESPQMAGGADVRPLTAADMRFGKRIIMDIIGGLEQGLPQVVPQRLSLEAVSDDPHMDLGLSSGAGLFRCAIDVGAPNALLGTAMIGIPTGAVPVLFGESEAAAGGSEAGVARVLSLPVEAVAELARVPMTLSRVRALEVGDELSLGSPRQIEVRVRGKRALLAEPGVKDGVRCIRVVRNDHHPEGR